MFGSHYVLGVLLWQSMRLCWERGGALCIEELFSSPYMGRWGLKGGCSLFNFREISEFVINRHVWER